MTKSHFYWHLTGGKAENLKAVILNGRGNRAETVSGLDGQAPAEGAGGILALIEPIAAILQALADVLNSIRPAPLSGVPAEPLATRYARTPPTGIPIVPFLTLATFTILLLNYGHKTNFRMGSAE